MIIAVNAVTPVFKSVATGFFQNIFLSLAAQQPQHQFVFIGFNTIEKNAPVNCSFINSGFAIKSPLRFTYWLNYQLPSLLKKNKAALLVTYGCCSQRCQLPQLLYTADVNFLSNSSIYKKSWVAFYKKNMPLFLQKAAHIITPSLFIQNKILEEYNLPKEKVIVIYSSAHTLFKPAVHRSQKETVKERLCNGREYFLYSGIISAQQNLINLLKAFTFFKQRQKSNMALVLASVTNADADFVKTLSSYKYRGEVILAESLPASELVAITTAAYAMVYTPVYDGEGMSVIEALQCHTPIIAANTGALPEICGEAAAWCLPDDFNDIAAKMMLLFTNEDRRNVIIATSRGQAQKFDMESSINSFWQLIETLATVN